MTSVGDNASTAPSIIRARKSPFNRLSSLFASKASQISEFDIELDEPHRQYGPGDTVQGKIVLVTTRPLGVTHIVVSLHGYVQVFKNHNRPRAAPQSPGQRAATGRGKRWVTEYYGDGYASLFEEEIVLCGEGRLDPNVYHFKFNIQFPKHLGLPSSIEFERGSICYLVTSTLTRPATITPTLTAERSVLYRDRIDVSAAPAPKPRVVTLEPIDRNGKARSNIKRLTSYTSDKKRNSPASMTSRDARSTRTLNSTSSTILYEEASSERPPSPSVASTLSASSTAPRGSIHQPSEPRSSVVSASPRVQIDVPPSRTITASVKLDRTGCLPGDIVPVRISIEHVKAVRSVNGIVVTLYRQARVDQHPNLPIGPADDIENSRYEDYYPRSRTGLGGLSLSAAGSSQVWRKDLSQTFAPLMVNPHTLRAEAKVGIRVPEDAFPSIRNAPGEMISFTYSVEVVIDIHGKLGTAGSILPKLSMVDSNMSSLGTSASVGEKQKGETLTAWGVNCIDTTQIRREKNAITCVCDLVIGTMDSGKAKLRKRSETSQTDSQNAPSSTDEDFMRRDQQTAYQNGDARTQPNESYAHWDGYGHRSYSGYDEYYDQYGYENGYDYNYNNDPYYYYEQGLPATNGHGTVAPPQIEDEDGLPEKERLRRAEARMVPSEPPLEGESSGTTASHAPSAPYLPNGGYHDTVTLNAPAASSVPSSHTLPVHADFSEASDSNGTTTTPYNAPIATAPKFSQAADDKQELERQRLEAEASAPDIAHTEAGPSSAEARPDATASAPSMTEEDEIRTFGPPTVLGENGEFIAREQLPQYER